MIKVIKPKRKYHKVKYKKIAKAMKGNKNAKGARTEAHKLAISEGVKREATCEKCGATGQKHVINRYHKKCWYTYVEVPDEIVYSVEEQAKLDSALSELDLAIAKALENL